MNSDIGVNRNRKGFTLSEVLITVLILVILFALIVPGIFILQRNLKQKELDTKAETIYTAVQNRLSELYAQGNMDVYDPDIHSDLVELNKIPDTYYTESNENLTQHIYYFMKNSDIAGEIVDDSVLSDELDNDECGWVIEMIPKSAVEKGSSEKEELTAATVFAVYYSDDQTVLNDYVNGSITDDSFRISRDERISTYDNSPKVGYYDGSGASGSNTSSVTISNIQINSNEEINTAVVTVRRPVGLNSNKLSFSFTLKDVYNNAYTMDYSNNLWTSNGNTIGNAKSFLSVETSGLNIVFTIKLDDLSQTNTRFDYLFGMNSSHTSKLVAGSDITLNAEVTSSDKRVKGDKKSASGNSIFGYEKSFNTTSTVAQIKCGRHLQNLDESSGLIIDQSEYKVNGYKEITSAIIENEISFSEDSDFYDAYKGGYFNQLISVDKITQNGNVTSIRVPNFKSIRNSKLKSIETNVDDDGDFYSIYQLSSKENGLFYEANDLSLTGIQLVGERIYGSQTIGGFIGTVKGNVSILNCASYLDSSNGDIPTNITADKNLESVVWLRGNVVGGLVGNNIGTLTIEKSFVSSVLGNEGSTVGGLVGSNSGSITMNISYADSYMYGKCVGGLVGTSSTELTIKDAYSAGFIGLDQVEDSVGAGIVNGKANLSDAYTIIACYNRSEDGGIDMIDTSLVGSYIATSNNENTAYYLRSNTSGTTYGQQLYKSTVPSSAFTKSATNKLVPYQMMGQSLSGYTYARLKDLPHYGDWNADFISGALVYYEQYDDGYGFEGANLSNTLKNDSTIIGDGYGILYKANDTDMPESVTITINQQDYSINTKNSDHISVTVNTDEYWIYPLTKEVLNVDHYIDGYYERITLNAENTETKYYDFNPHFARSVKEVSENASISNIPTSVSIRSPRQLYNLATYFDDGYQKYTSITYKQERDIVYSVYDWNTYTPYGIITQQIPIGEGSSFNATYDGTCYKITDISFEAGNGNYVGMFGQVGETGKVLNTVLVTQYSSTSSYYVKRNKVAVQNETIYEGVLVGKNKGTIRNCATAGYDLSSRDGTVYGYSNSKLYIGGFVGYNEGDIRNCSSDHPSIKLRMDNAQAYAGGFVGYNATSGNIYNTYALSHISSNASNGKTVIAGFSAYNAGSITQSYCATALTAAGSGSNAYAFGSKEGNGSTKSSYYLSQGSYRFVNDLYSYGRGNSITTDTSVNINDSTGIPATFSKLVSMSNNANAQTSLYCDITKQLSNDTTINYPMKAVVKDGNGSLIHYGEWIVKPDLGYYGVYYWEHETGGENEGYKLTYIGFDVENQTIYQQSTLCDSHDDGGVVKEYGYGYFESKDLTSHASLTTNGIVLNTSEALNGEAKQQFETQMPEFTFYPYATGDNLKIDGDNTNGTFILSIKDIEYTFHVSPFFANALSFDQPNGYQLDEKVDTNYINTTPGLENTAYEIRSIQQLQYINWNAYTQNTTTAVDNSTYTYQTTEQTCYWWGSCTDSIVTKNDNVYKHFNYLMYTTVSGTGSQTKQSAGNSDRSNFKYLQSHDLNGKDYSNFTPIAGQSTSSNGGYNAMLYSWFGSSYDGQSYKIQELSITTDRFTVGVFGVTAGANMKNIILYSETGSIIERASENTSTAGAYALGGLIGIAYDYEETKGTNTISNCAIAGYQIIDNSKNTQTLGEANVGGLIGVANVKLQKCSAVVDIQINATHKDQNGNFTKATWGNFIRVGGLTGATQYKISDCYTGGNITVGEEILNESYNSYGRNVSTTNSNGVVSLNNSTNIYISGISGSGFAMNYQNFTNSSGLKEGKPAVDNSYTYMNFPAMQGTIRSISMITSLADRFNNVWDSDGVMIQNCYYLENSSNFNTDNLPKYHIGDSRYTSPATLIQDATYKQAMLSGNAKWMTKVSGNNDYGDVSGRKYEVTSKSYTELSSNEMITSLKDAWYSVTTLENGQDISGKYSFHAGQSKLERKNYPFPTVIQQPEENETVNVHYGEWPFDGAYWENGSDVMNLFDCLDENGVAKKQFKIIKNGDSEIDTSTISVTGDTEYIEDVTEITKDSDGNYLVTIAAKKTGSVKVTASFGNKEASFILNITGDFVIQSDKEEMQLAEGHTETATISATSTVSNVLTDVAWQIQPSCDMDEKGDVGYELVDDSSNVNQKSLTITGYGNNATVLITATKNYNGIDYTSTKRITITKTDFVGLSNQTTFNEATLKDTGKIEGNNVSYTEEDKPVYSDASYYLYERKTTSILSNSTITGKIIDGTDVVESAEVKIGNDIYESNEYRYLPVSVDLRDVTQSLQSPVLQISITNENTTYVLKVDLNLTSEVLQSINEETNTQESNTNQEEDIQD